MLKSFENKVGVQPISCLRLHPSALERVSAQCQYLENKEIFPSTEHIFLCINDCVT